MTQKAVYRKREYLSYSTLMSFIRCPRRYMYQKMGIATHDEAPALHYGTAMHKAIDVAMTEGLDSAMKAFDTCWSDSMADAKRSRQRAREQLQHFIFSHSKGRSLYERLPAPKIENTTGLELDKSVSPLEIPFAIDIGLPIPLMGRLDGWCRHRDTGEIYGFEFKTASRLSSGLFDCLEMNPQVLSYALVLRTVLGQKVRGVMYEAMLIDPKKVECLTHPVLVQDHHIDDIALMLRYYGSMLLACEERGEFPKNFAGCSAYPLFYTPASHCEFENLCRVPDYNHMLGYYQIKPEHSMVKATVEGAPVS